MYDERTNLSAAVASDLRDFYGQQVFETVIPRNVRLAEAPSYGKPITLYDAHSKGAEAYSQLAKEIIGHDTKGIGSGLGALLSAEGTATATEETDEVAINLIDPSSLQPRSVFDGAKLEELAKSITANGVVQPLLLRRKGLDSS